MQAAERARWTAIADIVERWEPGLEAVAIDSAIAVATCQRIEGVLVVDCSIVELEHLTAA